MKSYVVYGVTVIVIVVSTICVVFLPVNSELKTIFSLPGIAGLFSLLVQGWRDQIAYERDSELQRRQHNFDLAVASHMANKVFDKQVEFTEQYTRKFYLIVQKLFQDGPSDTASIYEKDLREIRVQFLPWISNDLNKKLISYEFALGKIGNFGMLERATRNTAEHSEYVLKMFEFFKEFIGMAKDDSVTEPQAAADAVLGHLKEVLDIYDLEVLRRTSIRLAKGEIDNGGN